MLRKPILLILATIVTPLLGVTPSSGCGKPLPSQPHAGHSHNFDALVQDPNLGEVFDCILFLSWILNDLLNFRPTESTDCICQLPM